jgi:hydroxyacylglutathione hydrolase
LGSRWTAREAKIRFMHVEIVPCLRDNYTYVVSSEAAPGLLVVDPCEPVAVLAAVERRAQPVVAILNTHHHADHVGGNREILAKFPACRVYAHDSDRGRIPGQSDFLNEGDELTLLGLQFTVWYIPGHTRGHIAYIADGGVDAAQRFAKPPSAFVGDTLFGAGCGRVLEGTAEQLYDSVQRIGGLTDETRLYFAHEYTESNLRFAAVVEPGNEALVARVREVSALRAQGYITTPSNVGLERRTNPFLRAHEPAIGARYTDHSGAPLPPAQVFARLRAEKDTFK